MKAVLFDLDNTLYDYDMCNLYAEKMLFLKIMEDTEISREIAEKYLKEAKLEVKKKIKGTASEHNRLLYMQAICEKIGVSSVCYAKEWYDTYWDNFLVKCSLYDYVMPLLEYLKNKGISVVIVTDLTALIQYRKLKVLGLTPYINYIVTSEEVGAEKPSPLMFMSAIEKVGCDVSEVIMVGDSYERDICGAEKLGIKGILYTKDIDIVGIIKSIV